MYRIYSDGRGLQLELNKEFTSTLGEHEVRFFEGVVRAGLEGFGSLYFSSKGFLNNVEPDGGAGAGRALAPKASTKKKQVPSIRKRS